MRVSRKVSNKIRDVDRLTLRRRCTMELIDSLVPGSKFCSE